jgi:hypothetical protein
MYKSVLFDAGTFWIGDLCYVMSDEWDEVCDLTIQNNKCVGGVYQLANGRKFGMWYTAYGDGVYFDNNGNEYPVDSGSIGIILVEDISETGREEINLGNVFKFETSFDTTCADGVFIFDNIHIDTRG